MRLLYPLLLFLLDTTLSSNPPSNLPLQTVYSGQGEGIDISKDSVLSVGIEGIDGEIGDGRKIVSVYLEITQGFGYAVIEDSSGKEITGKRIEGKVGMLVVDVISFDSEILNRIIADKGFRLKVVSKGPGSVVGKITVVAAPHIFVPPSIKTKLITHKKDLLAIHTSLNYSQVQNSSSSILIHAHSKYQHDITLSATLSTLTSPVPLLRLSNEVLAASWHHNDVLLQGCVNPGGRCEVRMDVSSRNVDYLVCEIIVERGDGKVRELVEGELAVGSRIIVGGEG